MSRVNVSPSIANPTHELKLSDGIQSWGMRLDRGAAGIQERPQRGSSPLFASMEQRTWIGGRGLEEWADDPRRYLDAQNLITLVPGRAFPAPQWKFASGLRTTYENLPGNMNWLPLIGTQRYFAATFTVGGSAFDAQKVYIWLRKQGAPGTLTIQIWTDVASAPGSLVTSASGTVTTSTITDILSVFKSVDVSAAANLSASTAYWVVVFGASTDSRANHWRIGYASGSSGQKSSDGSSWSASTAKIYFRVTDADVVRRFRYLFLDGGLYAVDEKANAAAAQVYMNGKRGKATSGGATTLTDTNATFGSSSAYVGASVRIINGTGDGQTRSITSHTATALTVPAWNTAPDSTSEYIVYKTAIWVEITGHGLTKPVSDVAVANGIAYFAQGTTAMRRMRFNAAAAPPAHEFEAEVSSTKADLLHSFYDTRSSTVQMWRAIHSTTAVSRVAPAAWGAGHTWGSDIPVGSKDFRITELADFNGALQVFKEDSLWNVIADKADRYNVGLEAVAERTNGAAWAVQDNFLYFSWSHSVERLYGAEIKDVGPWSGSGLPDGRRGPIAAIEPVVGWLFMTVDAQSWAGKTSCVLAYDPANDAYCELFRAWETNLSCQGIKWQPCPGTNPYLWINVGGEMVYQVWAHDTQNLLKDSTVAFQHEAELITGVYDMRRATLPKLFSRAFAIADNLGSTTLLSLYFQFDGDIGSTTWIPLGDEYVSPEASWGVSLGNIRAGRFRLLFNTSTATTPPVARAFTVEGYARPPVKYEYTLRVKVSSLQRTLAGTPDARPDDFLDWVKQTSRGMSEVSLSSIWAQLQGRTVLVEPPSVIRTFTNNILHWWGGVIVITLLEV